MSAELTDYQRGVLAGLSLKTTQLRAVYAAICANPGVTAYRLGRNGHPHARASIERLQEAGLIVLEPVGDPCLALACYPAPEQARPRPGDNAQAHRSPNWRPPCRTC